MCGICGFTGYRQDQKTVIERMMKPLSIGARIVRALFAGRRSRWVFEDLVLLI